MYIKYNELAKIAALFLPAKIAIALRKWGLEKKISENEKYIKKNRVSVLKKLKKKIARGEKINVAFHIYDASKWKCQEIFNLLDKDEHFHPYIVATRCGSDFLNTSYQEPNMVFKTFDFFKNKNMEVYLSYDPKENKFLPFEKLNPRPDIIFYQHPWYVVTNQGPVVCSKFALTYYVPYFVATSVSPIEYYLRFHRYIQAHYVPSKEIKEYYSKNMANGGKNLVASGHPILDYFYINSNKQYEDKKWVIYAPHWSIDSRCSLGWGTFLWSGKFMLDYAKKHSEINWVFKPHPGLAQTLLAHSHMTKEQIDKYWSEWEKLGVVHTTGDYLDMFMESSAMITDCGSFETEYFLTKKPLIHLFSKNAMPFNPFVTSLVESYYSAKDETELENTLDRVVIQGDDWLYNKRKQTAQRLNFKPEFASEKIFEDIKKTLEINHCL